MAKREIADAAESNAPASHGSDCAGAAGADSRAAPTARRDNFRPSPDGLTSDEAARRLAQFGANEPAPSRRIGPLLAFLRFCSNPLVIILLVASAISALLGQMVNAALVAAMVVLSVVLNFLQAYRSERSVQRLREQVAPTATVLRDGIWREIPRRALVPGDIIRLSAGDLVPADATLLESRDLHVQEAALTGESVPVEKFASRPAATAAPGETSDTILLGSSVISGTGQALVFATGKNTAFGEIAARLSTRPPDTEFDRGVRQFGILIMKTVVFLVLFILLVSVAMHRNALESLLFAVALAVGLTPEFLPMITTVTLSTGAIRMARKRVVVKHLAAIQNFGSIDVLCSDKTGTLTASQMTLEGSLDPFGAPAERPLFLAWLNSHFETGIRSPLDAAITRDSGFDAGAFRKLDEIPFDFERRRLSIAVEDERGCLLVTKGAPEAVIAACTAFETDRRYALGDEQRRRCAETFEALSRRGFRVLAVAYRDLGSTRTVTVEDERELVLVGFLTFIDPPSEGVGETIAGLKRDGVEIKILTGDNELVTREICSQVGIDATRILLGRDLDAMSDAALAHMAEQVDVFARLSPAQKNRIIRALKSRSHVVGFLGDGVNDAPSLHAADVGISVANAVDVARDAADIILLDRSLQVLHSGIIEGRKAFGNVFKYLMMGTSSNFGNMFSMAGAVLFLPFLPMLPTQILLNNFLYDLAQVTIPTDNVDPVYIRRPQHWDIGLIRNFMVLIGPVSSIYDFLTFFVLLYLFQSSEPLFHTGWFVESLTTQTLVLFIIRTVGSPWESRPSRSLAVTTVLVVVIGALLPFSRWASLLGFVPLPIKFFAFLALATGTYLVAVELMKRAILSRLIRPQSTAEVSREPGPP
jgi:Mg2+-importing ATPase